MGDHGRVLGGCGSDETVAIGETQADAADFDASALPSCAPDDSGGLVIVEGGGCNWQADGLFVFLELQTAWPVLGSHDVYAWEWGICRNCVGSDCEAAATCIVEITASSDTEIEARIDAEFPSGAVSRSLRVHVCANEDLHCP